MADAPSHDHPWRRELRASFRLALPIMGVQVGMLSMGAVDVAMVGRLSTEDLGSIALGDLYVWGISVFGLGVLTVLDGVLAQGVGAGDERAIGLGIRRGVVLACLLALPITGLCFLATEFLTALEQPAELIPDAVAYCNWSAPGILPLLLFAVLRAGLQSQSRVAPVLWTILAANLLNALTNWLFIFGNWGAPALGLRGAALASVLSRWWMTLGLLWIGRSVLWPHLRRWSRRCLELAPLGRLLRLGSPAGAQFLLEMGAFAYTMLMVGWLSTEALGGHQVAIKLASMTFMFPLGISIAASVRVGQAVGREDQAGLRRAATANLVLGSGIMALFAVLFLTVPGACAAIYTDQAAPLAVAASLLPIAGVFQVFDGIQVVCVGILRGCAETRIPALVNLLGFWGIGLPTSFLLAFKAGLGAQGLWWGLVAGLGAVALVLAWRVKVRLGRVVERIRID